MSFGNAILSQPAVVNGIIALAGKLVEQRKYSDAAAVLEQYAQVNSVPPFYTSPKQGLFSCTLATMKVKGTGGI